MAEEDKAMPSFSTETEEDDSQPTTSREHYQACLNIAEARRRKAKPTDAKPRAEAKLIWIMPRREGGRR